MLKVSCHDLLHLPAETEKDALFEPGYVALRNTHAVGDLLLRILPPPEQPETQPPANNASDPKPLAPTGDDGALKAASAAVATAAAVGAAAFATAHAETKDERA